MSTEKEVTERRAGKLKERQAYSILCRSSKVGAQLKILTPQRLLKHSLIVTTVKRAKIIRREERKKRQEFLDLQSGRNGGETGEEIAALSGQRF